MLRDILRVARKELGGFFASPAAYLFIAAFLLATFFVFFWLETFFSRNIADVRPLFKWLPVLLIFLVAALTMRTWSEERRAGTLETLLTSPVSTLALVLGKFLAGLGLVAIALALTLPLPITVACLGPLDWGPVIGGYVATMFLAAAYLAIGQYMSARTDNPVVALILAAVVCGVFYLIGSDALGSLFGTNTGALLALVGTGTRFESITRGVLDLRDLYYYISLVGLFLTLNLYSLERLRWAGNPASRTHRNAALLAGLTAANFIAANLWLAPVGWMRADITSGHLYSLSSATRETLASAQEPLQIRAYFSTQTHPLLAPLVPQLRDLLQEYAVIGGHKVKVEFINPQTDKQGEEDAAKYGVQPVPFQVASKYQAGVVSSYFDVVIAYGDQFEHLGFRDLIEVKARSNGEADVALRDPEYAITRAVRKVIAGYQSGGSPFAHLQGKLTFHAYVSPEDRLPEALQGLRRDLATVLADLDKESAGKMHSEFTDPEANGGQLGRTLTQRFGVKPQIASLLDPRPFWFYLQIEGPGGTQQVALPNTPGADALRHAIVASLQRMGSGALKTIALVAASDSEASPGGGYGTLHKALEDNARVIDTDLSSGRVPADADLLMVLSPSGLNDKQVFAIDQFLMQGGSVILNTSPLNVSLSDSIYAAPQHSGLNDWLSHLGLSIDNKIVLDPQNAPLPLPSVRYVNGIPLQEMHMLPYPAFPDVRDGLSHTSPITANLRQLTFSWPSPIRIDPARQAALHLDVLARSSPESWLADGKDAAPDFSKHPDGSFEPAGKREASTLAVALTGSFESFYKGKTSPLAQLPTAASLPAAEASAPAKDPSLGSTGVIERSPQTAKLILVASNQFASDTAINIASNALGTLYTAPFSFMQNAVDWSLEDSALLALRGRTQFARTLDPIEPDREQFWEILNYAAGIAGLVIVWVIRRAISSARRTRQLQILKEVSA